MPRNPAAELQAWIDARLEKLLPGERLPTDRRLAQTFGVSSQTVYRLLSRYARQERICRVPGRGTFKPGEKPGPEKRIDIAESSSETLAAALKKMIFSGEINGGDPLPQVKYIAQKFKIGNATVIAAYQHLRDKGFVTKLGKTFWVGAIENLLKQPARKQVFLVKQRSLDFSDIFRDNMLAPAYRNMERELTANGFCLRFESSENIERVFDGFLKTAPPPAGIILFNTPAEDFSALVPKLDKNQKKARQRDKQNLPVLLDLRQGAFLDKIPRDVSVISRGHFTTSGTQTMAEYIVRRKKKNTVIFVDCTRTVWNIGADAFMIKLWVEVFNLNPEFSLKMVVKPENPGMKTDEFIQMYLDSFKKGNFKVQLAKYRGITVADLQKNITVCADPQTLFHTCAENALWVFSHASNAVAAYRWCAGHGVKVPNQVSMISFENSADCYHLGISYCDPDMEKFGHSMAHAISGIYPVEKTTKGFIRTHARLLHRLTSEP
ncbi:MAG: GntR family transcriptional regulator [Chitinivibrionales bacterium]|nr:GntR family transcriptional regulator [Chitinivibrionales bacterium]